MKKLVLFFALALSTLLTTQAMVLKAPTAETPTTTSIDMSSPYTTLQSFQSNLEAKEAAEGLSKIERRALRKIERQLKKWDRRAERRIADGKSPAGGRSWIAAVLLAFFLGGLGIHRFYLGYTWQGVVQLLTLGGLGIWALIDFIRILMRDLQPANGPYTD